MALSMKQRRELLALDLPKTEKVVAALRDYLAKSGLAPADFAARVNYSTVSLNAFLQGRYAQVSSNDSALRKAITEFIDKHPLDAIEETGGKLYETQNSALLRKYFDAMVEHGYAYCVDGGPGSQKTFVAQHLIAELNRREIPKNGCGRRAYYVYCREGISPTQLIRRIAEAMAVPAVGDIERILKNLRFEFRGRRAGLVLDEAQHLSIPCLEVARELVDRPPFLGLLLMGSHELRATFETKRLVLEQWNSRLRASKSLPGIQHEEAVEIIRGELGALPPAKCEQLIKAATTRDLRAGVEHTYISARRLFGSLREIREQLEARSKGKAATA